MSTPPANNTAAAALPPEFAAALQRFSAAQIEIFTLLARNPAGAAPAVTGGAGAPATPPAAPTPAPAPAPVPAAPPAALAAAETALAESRAAFAAAEKSHAAAIAEHRETLAALQRSHAKAIADTAAAHTSELAARDSAHATELTARDTAQTALQAECDAYHIKSEILDNLLPGLAEGVREPATALAARDILFAALNTSLAARQVLGDLLVLQCESLANPDSPAILNLLKSLCKTLPRFCEQAACESDDARNAWADILRLYNQNRYDIRPVMPGDSINLSLMSAPANTSTAPRVERWAIFESDRLVQKALISAQQ